ncbi:hypothetical protein, partial [Bifidobacterium callimiconis]|uniref:hypothetical protein n=1 Tax=Bifidobacterium callimiconis TaxID=2306973 RepID=UPI0019D2B1CC
PKNPTTITAPLEALQKQEPWPDWQSKLSSTKHALEFSNHHHTNKPSEKKWTLSCWATES